MNEGMAVGIALGVILGLADGLAVGMALGEAVERTVGDVVAMVMLLPASSRALAFPFRSILLAGLIDTLSCTTTSLKFPVLAMTEPKCHGRIAIRDNFMADFLAFLNAIQLFVSLLRLGTSSMVL
jgi:hypothetical protein